MGTIQRLVTAVSSVKRKAVEPIGERASSKLRVPVTAAPNAATKPKARFPNGFFAFCRQRMVKGFAALKEVRRMMALALMGLLPQMANDRRTTQSPHEGSHSWNQAQPDLLTIFLPVRARQLTGQKSPAPMKDNRMQTTHACVPSLVEASAQERRDCDIALAHVPMNRPAWHLVMDWQMNIHDGAVNRTGHPA